MACSSRWRQNRDSDVEMWSAQQCNVCGVETPHEADEVHELCDNLVVANSGEKVRH
jgi:ABC-type Na+ transport system ATPase subunit NatA